MTRCCVIGGTGFIGRHLVDLLVKKNRSVVVLGRRSAEMVKLPAGVKYHAHDYSDEIFLANILSNIDEIICLAYTTNPKTSYDNPMTDLTTNLFPMVNLFRLASQMSIRKLIVISSGGAIYGPVSKTPIKEDCATSPVSPYGITKLAIEKYAFMFHRINHLPVVIVRPGNGYGPGQKPFTGQGFIATAIASILTGKAVTIFGKKGTIRDYIYVTDLAEGIIAAMERGKDGSCYNLGSGIGKNNLEVLRQITSQAVRSGSKVKFKTMPKRPFDVDINILDSSRLKKDAGWKIKTSFDQGVKLTWDWYINNQDKWL